MSVFTWGYYVWNCCKHFAEITRRIWNSQWVTRAAWWCSQQRSKVGRIWKRRSLEISFEEPDQASFWLFSYISQYLLYCLSHFEFRAFLCHLLLKHFYYKCYMDILTLRHWRTNLNSYLKILFVSRDRMIQIREWELMKKCVKMKPNCWKKTHENLFTLLNWMSIFLHYPPPHLMSLGISSSTLVLKFIRPTCIWSYFSKPSPANCIFSIVLFLGVESNTQLVTQP